MSDVLGAKITVRPVTGVKNNRPWKGLAYDFNFDGEHYSGIMFAKRAFDTEEAEVVVVGNGSKTATVGEESIG